jgi:hypothetical protein
MIDKPDEQGLVYRESCSFGSPNVALRSFALSDVVNVVLL